MSSCLSGGTGRAYGFDLETIVKWQSSASCSRTTSHSSSPSSTLSESTNSPITISNRKPRTPRKRPNQTYNEAAALLSAACPNIFSSNNKNLSKFTKIPSNLFHEPPELIENSGFLLHLEKPIEPKVVQSPVGIGWNWNWNWNSVESGDGYEDNFDTKSMLDGEIEEGIDSIMGNSDSKMKKAESVDNDLCNLKNCYGYPMGLGFGEFNSGFGMRNGIRALKNGNGWSFPAVEVTVNISTAAPAKPKKAPVEKKKIKKIEELMKGPELESEPKLRQGNLNSGDESLGRGIGTGLLLKLNYDAVLNAWSDKGSALPNEIFKSESSRSNIHADLFSEKNGFIKCKQKKHSCLLSKKIKPRPKSKGRFVGRPNPPACEEET